jgi:hypothetical protein
MTAWCTGMSVQQIIDHWDREERITPEELPITEEENE